MAVRLPTSSSLSLLRFPTRTTHAAGNSNIPQPALNTHRHISPHFLSLNLHHFKTTTTTRRRNLHSALIKAIEDGNQENPTTTNQSTDEEAEKKTLKTFSGGVDELGVEIKETMKNIKERESESDDKVDFWSGVAEEIKEIEWPVFGKVLGTTGVVLGVIAGSSVVLLTVNAVLAELSDQAFAGKGVQDFFG
ncbi:Protein translocase complex [Macleaya cordata]|uniref:Protein translocase complex n=1 Tax=Macleaya cordata TaxID=56857 RepID=A0A200R9C0_MACCD|nr:Protein translocase complex [Macleaya cordata]